MKINQVIVDESIKLGDNFDIELGNMVIESRVVGFMDDGIVIEADDKALALLGTSGALLEATDNDYWTNLIADVRAKAEAKERERWAAQAEIRDKERAEQLAKDRENLPTLEKYLAQLQSEYDPDYEYSDDHRVWTRNKEIKAKISNLQQRIKDAKGVSEVYAPAVGGKDFDQYTPAVGAAMTRHSAEKALYKAANPKDDPTGALQQKGFDRAQAVGQRLATKQALGKIKANETDDSFTKPAIIMRASPKAMAKAQSIIQKQADKNVISMAKIAGTTPAQGVAEEHHPSNPMYEIHSQGQQAGIAGKPRNNPYGDPDINREAYYWNEGYELGLEIRNKRQGVAEGSDTYKQGHAKFHTNTNKQIGPTHYGRGSDKKADSYTKADPRYHEVRPVKEQGVAEGHADQQRKIFKKNGQPVGEVGIDRESSPGVGQYYMKHYASGTDLSGYDSREEAVEELRHLVKQGVAEGSEIKIPTEDGITWQDIRLMAGEGKLTKKTVLQAIAVIRKQRSQQGVAEGSKETKPKKPMTWQQAYAHNDGESFDARQKRITQYEKSKGEKKPKHVDWGKEGGMREGQEQGVAEGSETAADIDKKIEFHKQGQAAAQYKGSMNKMHAAKIRELEAKKKALKQGVAEGSAYQHHVVSKLDGNVLASYKTREEAQKNAHGNPVVSGSLETIGDRQYTREQGVAEGVTPASVSKVLRLIDRHHPEWFDNYGMGEVEDTVVILADMGQFSGMSATDALELVGQELERLYGQQGMAEGYLEEYGDTAKGQKMLTRVQKRAVDRVIKADDKNRLEPDVSKRDLKTVRKNVATADRAWDRMTDKDVAEGSQTVGHEILGMLRQINRQGDDAMEELYSSCPLLAQFWDQYEGDFRSMVIELSPKTLNRIKAEISAFNQQGVSEGNGTHIKRENPGQWRKAGYERGRFWAQHSGTRDTKGFADQQARDQWIRDQNNKVVAEGRMKEQMHTDAERMELAEFLDKYGNEDWVKEFWQNVNADISEAKYQGREVPLGKPMAGDVKKSKVYVRGPKGNVVKVNFGDKNMRIKKSNPKRRKSFRARHNCANPGPRWKARYWSCRAW